MKDFAAKLPRVAALALAFAEAKGDITEPSKALIDAALVDIPALGWEAPFTLLQQVRAIHAAREAAGEITIHFDEQGNGPNCKHGGIPFLCNTCGRPESMERALRSWLVELARAS
jgi:hypothetical protein